MHHLADPSLRDAKPAGKVLTGDHRVVGHEIQRPFLRRADAEGSRSLRRPLGTGQRRPHPTGGLGAKPSSGAAVGAHVLQRVVRAADPRVFAPEAKVPSFERVPGLHGDEAVIEVQLYAEPRRQPLLPYAGGQDQDGARNLAGKPLAGFRATPSRRIPVLYGMVVYAIRFNNQLLHRQPTLRKRRLGENRGFRPDF